jgi:cytochrome c oxidase subunit 3
MDALAGTTSSARETLPAVERRAQARPAPLVLGMVIFISSEMMFFGGLFAAYFFLRSATAGWPPPGTEGAFTPEAMRLAVIASLVLWSSSVPAHLSTQALRGGDFPGMRRWLLLTIGMGILFLIWKVYDWLTAGFSVSSHAYGTIFFALTGFHALHMAVGLILLGGVVARIAQGAYRHGDHAGPEAVTYYWHFVDAVWLGVFTTVFIIR